MALWGPALFLMLFVPLLMGAVGVSTEQAQVMTVSTQDERSAVGVSTEQAQVMTVSTQDERSAVGVSTEQAQVMTVSTQDERSAASGFLSLISLLEQTVYTSVGRNLTLQCSFRGNPNFHCTWLWQDPQGRVIISRMTLSSNTIITTELRIPSINHWHFGDYLCRAWNEHTTVEGVMHVRYEGEKARSGGKTGTFSGTPVIIAVIIALYFLLLIIVLVARRKGDSADTGNPEEPAQKAGGTQQ